MVYRHQDANWFLSRAW